MIYFVITAVFLFSLGILANLYGMVWGSEHKDPATSAIAIILQVILVVWGCLVIAGAQP